MNRLVGNVVIVDSGMGNAFVLTSANQVIHLDDFKIQTISFFMSSTLGSLKLTQANTLTDEVFTSNAIVTGIVTAATNVFVQLNPVSVTFPLGFRASDLKVPTLTAGTAYIYLA
jgi:hypothetical protein